MMFFFLLHTLYAVPTIATCCHYCRDAAVFLSFDSYCPFRFLSLRPFAFRRFLPPFSMQFLPQRRHVGS